MTQTFKAFRVHTIDGKPVCKFEQLTMADIDTGDVCIKVAYSAVNYKDAMAARGVGKNIRTDRPCVAGVDLSGVVVSSEDNRFKPGQHVLVTNYQLGTSHDGAYAGYACVPADWIVAIPDGISLYEAMVLGTSGLTAALCVDRLEKAGLQPSDGPVAVTGATGGVGSIVTNLLAGRGYHVVAITGKQDQADFLKDIGAAVVMSRETFMENNSPLAPGLFAGAIENVGGKFLDRLLAQMKPHGQVALGGMAVGAEVSTTVLPFVLRAVDLLGINVSRQLKMPDRVRLWNRLATDLKATKLDKIAHPIPFEDLNKVMDKFFEVSVVGRIVVEVGEKAPN